MDKSLLSEIGTGMMRLFCVTNQIPEPGLHLYMEKNHPEAVKIKRVGTCGYYRSHNIHVAVPHCAHNNANYSWPGFISDRTPYGVIQHELGHHIDEVYSNCNVYRTRSGNFYSDKIRAISGEKPITSYSPDTMEWFAEIFRLFVTNPDLLRQIRPKAYAALIADFKPIIDKTAGEIMEHWHAPARVFGRMQKWIDQSA